MITRLYTGPKDTSIFNHLVTEPYKNIMKNNINMEDSFNSIEISIQKVLNEPNTALFWYLEDVVSEKYKCLVRLIYYKKKESKLAVTTLIKDKKLMKHIL